MPSTSKTMPTRRRARQPKPSTVETLGSTEGAAPLPPAQTKSLSKIAKIIELLRRAEGATLEEMIEATGWLPHTTRAAMTGLKKKGHVIERRKRGEASCYKIVASEA